MREEIHHVREGKHGVRSPQQAIAIGLSKARRAGVKLAPPKGSVAVKRKAAEDERAGEHPRRKISRTRSRATEKALEREPRGSVSKTSLAKQVKSAAAKRGKRARSRSAVKAARTRKVNHR